jgi:thymidylate synthase
MIDNQYKILVQNILKNGTRKLDRTGTGTISIFGHQMKFNMNDGFPLLTLRKIHIKSMIHEMLWFLSSYDKKYEKFGNTNIRYLLDNGVTFWTDWPYKDYLKKMEYMNYKIILTQKEFENEIKINDDFALEFGSIGPGYGEQWLNSGSVKLVEQLDNKVEEKDDNVIRHTKQKITKLEGVNQINNIINLLKKNPDSRRIIVDSWNPMKLDDMLLPPCHMMFQFYSVKMNSDERYKQYMKKVELKEFDENIPYQEGLKVYNFPDRYLSLQLYQRSVDVGLGLPFNISEYSLLLNMISQVVNMIPFEFVWTGGDIHIYNNHIKQMNELILKESYPLPKIELNKNIKSIYDFRYDDINILNYKSNSNIKMDVSI